MLIDIIVGVILVISAIIAFLRGFIREVLTILGVVGGLIVAYKMGPWLSVYMDGWLGVGETEDPKKLFDIIPYSVVSDVASYGLIFIVVVVALSFVSHMIAESARNIGLGPMDRTLGAIFGIVRGALLLGLLYLPVHMLVDEPTKDRWFQGSKTHFYLVEIADWMQSFIPQGSQEEIRDNAEEIGENMDARERLQSIDLLRREGAEEDNVADDESGDETGYNEIFRDRMDELFEQGTEEPENPYNE